MTFASSRSSSFSSMRRVLHSPVRGLYVGFYPHTGQVDQDIFKRNLAQLLRRAVVDLAAQIRFEVLRRTWPTSPQVGHEPGF